MDVEASVCEGVGRAQVCVWGVKKTAFLIIVVIAVNFRK